MAFLIRPPVATVHGGTRPRRPPTSPSGSRGEGLSEGCPRLPGEWALRVPLIGVAVLPETGKTLTPAKSCFGSLSPRPVLSGRGPTRLARERALGVLTLRSSAVCAASPPLCLGGVGDGTSLSRGEQGPLLVSPSLLCPSGFLPAMPRASATDNPATPGRPPALRGTRRPLLSHCLTAVGWLALGGPRLGRKGVFSPVWCLV